MFRTQSEDWTTQGLPHSITQQPFLFYEEKQLQKSPQHERACAEGDGAICSKNRKIVSYHRDSPNTRNGACLWSPSPIMAPGVTLCFFSFPSFLILKAVRSIRPEKQILPISSCVLQDIHVLILNPQSARLDLFSFSCFGKYFGSSKRRTVMANVNTQIKHKFGN